MTGRSRSRGTPDPVTRAQNPVRIERAAHAIHDADPIWQAPPRIGPKRVRGVGNDGVPTEAFGKRTEGMELGKLAQRHLAHTDPELRQIWQAHRLHMLDDIHQPVRRHADINHRCANWRNRLVGRLKPRRRGNVLRRTRKLDMHVAGREDDGGGTARITDQRPCGNHARGGVIAE